MAGRFSKEQLKNKLQRSTFSLVASGGIESVTVRKVANGCGLSDPYIYQCYSDMTDLMTDAFLRIDKEIASLIATVIKKQTQEKESDIEENCWRLWSTYWKFLLDDPEKIVFYWRFYQSGYYSMEILEQRRENFQVFTSFIYTTGDHMGVNDHRSLDAAVSCIIDDTVSVAVKIHQGYLNENDIPAQAIYGSAFSYLLQMVKIDVWERLHQKEKYKNRGSKI
jgi:AcrR family transcriptional regulator